MITTCVGAAIGLVFYIIFKLMKLTMIGVILVLVFAVLGYSVGMFKMPDSNGLEITRKTGGENLDDIIKRYIKFKKNKRKLYVYTKEENLNE